jgi:hypothetical protein
LRYFRYEQNVNSNRLPAGIIREVEAALKESKVPLRRSSAPAAKKAVLARLKMTGWSPEVVIDSASKISITSVKAEIGLCFQTGNFGRIYADLLKLQTLYMRRKIKASVVIVPTKHAARTSGKNLAHYERLTGELKIFADVITLPLVVFGVEWGLSE